MLKITGIALFGTLLYIVYFFSIVYPKVGYHISGKRVYFHYYGNFGIFKHVKPEKKQVNGADLKSFTIIDGAYAKDANQVYIWGNIIENADPATFQIDGINQFLDRDAKRIFHVTKTVSEDADHYQVLGRNYARDRVHAYHLHEKIEGADGASFELIPGSFWLARDSKHIFSGKNMIANSHSPTFEILGDNYWKDQNRIYYISTPIENADRAFFQHLGGSYARDLTFVYAGSDMIKGADPESFVTFKDEKSGTSLYAKDKNRFYYQGKVVAELPEEYRVRN